MARSRARARRSRGASASSSRHSPRDQLFVDRASINLHSDILDHPEFFWEDDEWLPLYLRAAKYLEIDRRAEVLNKRLDIIKELFDMLAAELHNSHSNKLEWIVIILIVVEVVFEVVQMVVDIERFLT